MDFSDECGVALRGIARDDASAAGAADAGRRGERVGRHAHGDPGQSQSRSDRGGCVRPSVEWYFAPESLVSVGVFYKDVKTYIQTLRSTQPFNTLGIPDSVLIRHGRAANRRRSTTRGRSTATAARSKGVEVNLQMPLTFLPGLPQGLRRARELHARGLGHHVHRQPGQPQRDAGGSADHGRAAVDQPVARRRRTPRCTTARAGFEARVSRRRTATTTCASCRASTARMPMRRRAASTSMRPMSYTFNEHFQVIARRTEPQRHVSSNCTTTRPRSGTSTSGTSVGSTRWACASAID